MSAIGFYTNIEEVRNYTPSDIVIFLQGVKLGKWQDLILPIRTIEDQKKRQQKKHDTLPYVTISGQFKHREESGLTTHSGFIAIDLDDLPDINSTRDRLSEDDYVFSVFASASGRGLCAIVKIDGKKHAEAFSGLGFYLYDKFGLVVGACGDISRPRYVSYDPDLYINQDSKVFKKYLPKEEKKKSAPIDAIFIPEDFKQMIILLGPKNICDEYREWIRIGYALISKFGEDGREMYHTLSKESKKYDEAACDKQYDALLKTNKEEKKKKSSISTLFYYAKEHNIPFYSPKNQKIINDAVPLKNSGLSSDDIVRTLEISGVKSDQSKDIVDSIFASEGEIKPSDSIISDLENWLRYNYKFRRNVFTRKIEINGKDFTDVEFNSVYVSAKKVFDKSITTEMIQRIIDSSFTQDYNPFFEFYSRYEDYECDGSIDKYLNCFDVGENKLFKDLFKKWFVSIIASTYGSHSPLVLVFTGIQGNGKTETFRRLLPKELSHYYAESRLDLGKDDEILMTRKLIICDDEFGGKSKQESKKLKELTSKQIFSIREPYARYSIDLRRLAVLCGTGNEKEILNDATGNRRIIPIEIKSINFDSINEVDRISMFMEAHRLYKDGYNWQIGKDDIEKLNKGTEIFEEHSLEYELINKYFKIPEENETSATQMTATEIKVLMERDTNQKLSLYRIGQQLQKIGFIQSMEPVPGTKHSVKRIYKVIKLLNNKLINDNNNTTGYKPVPGAPDF